MDPLSLGYSPCPNDTYIFNALVHRLIPYAGPELAPPVLDDVETLNAWAMQGRFDITKLSCHAYGYLRDQYRVLSAGAALGRGCGPLLVTHHGDKTADPAGWRVAIPGRYTTAALLLQLYLPGCTTTVMRFDRIMDALERQSVDAGLIIHEGRFTYRERDLLCVQDLGEWWERETGFPIPLGCIAMKSGLGQDLHDAVSVGIVQSIRWAEAHPDACLPYIRAHAQELAPGVIQSHIDLYVNSFSKDLGPEGLAAIDELIRRGQAIGLLPVV